jgi:single-stranded-DNA-specific exonuclease
MRYKLIKPVDNRLNATEQILTNRGIPYTEIHHYLNTTDKDINEPAAFGSARLKEAAAALISTVYNSQHCLVVVDADCDGFTSSAILINYLYDAFPIWAENYLHYFIHAGKQHGLSDVPIPQGNFSLVICPDAASNDYEYHKALKNENIKVLVLDHHEAEKLSDDAIVINNQLSDYPNKNLSGAGVTWQFCRYLDNLLNKNYANEYLDLAALGNMADMMSLKSFETKHIILTGFKEENIKNPFIYEMAKKNAFSLGAKITPMGAAFYIAPFVNSMVRSGYPEEKELLFSSMLKHKAFQKIPSTKRGHAVGELERVVDQAVRTATNVKNRQTRVQDEGLEILEEMIETQHLLDHKVLLFLLKPNQVDRNIAGLIANKFMAKYQRPCCILTRVEEDDPNMTLLSFPPQSKKIISYQGSARGCDKVGITNFKDICAATGVTLYEEGHQGAFGLGILAENIQSFIEKTDAALVNMSDEPIYYVDYIYKGVDVKSDDILNIANLSDIWGKDMDEAYVAIEKIKISANMVTVYVKKNNTLKITLPNKITLMLFDAPDDLCDKLQNQNPGYIEMNIVGRCAANEWMGRVTPQVMIEDYEIIGQSRFNF